MTAAAIVGGYLALVAIVLAFLKGATRKGNELEESVRHNMMLGEDHADPDWMALHTEDEKWLMRMWGTSVHTEDDHCQVRCVVHNPSKGEHRALPPHWRGDRGILERICQHGVGHPDPDQWYWFATIGQTYQMVHGCDGCCAMWVQA